MAPAYITLRGSLAATTRELPRYTDGRPRGRRLAHTEKQDASQVQIDGLIGYMMKLAVLNKQGPVVTALDTVNAPCVAPQRTIE